MNISQTLMIEVLEASKSLTKLSEIGEIVDELKNIHDGRAIIFIMCGKINRSISKL